MDRTDLEDIDKLRILKYFFVYAEQKAKISLPEMFKIEYYYPGIIGLSIEPEIIPISKGICRKIDLLANGETIRSLSYRLNIMRASLNYLLTHPQGNIAQEELIRITQKICRPISENIPAVKSTVELIEEESYDLERRVKEADDKADIDLGIIEPYNIHNLWQGDRERIIIAKAISHGSLSRSAIKNSTGIAGYRKDLGHSVRSLFEANFARYLIYNNIQYVYEPMPFALRVNDECLKLFDGRSIVGYIPDYWIYGTNIIVEVKGTWNNPSSNNSKAKMDMFRKQYPQVTLVVIDQKAYDLIRRYYESKIDSDQRLVGWETGNRYEGDNLATNPQKYGK